MINVLAITSGFSSFVPELASCSQLSMVGVLDCSPSTLLDGYCKRHLIAYTTHIKQDANLIQWIKEKSPDVIAVFRMPFLLKKEIFSLPRYGSINIHPSLLPKYRGPNPWFWVYYNMEQESGVTVHLINEKEDSGDIVFQQKIKILPGASLKKLRDSSEEIGIRLMLKALCGIKDINSIPQPIASPTLRAINITTYQGLIDWQSWPVVRLWHLINGFPYIIESHPDYFSLDRKLKSIAYYVKEEKGERIGRLIRSNHYYILNCIDGIILFEIE
jgi:methionyl-tRNA formyltransferase